jgi:hypothetical protein
MADDAFSGRPDDPAPEVRNESGNPDQQAAEQPFSGHPEPGGQSGTGPEIRTERVSFAREARLTPGGQAAFRAITGRR